MRYQLDDEKLYSIQQVAKITGLSRSTLMRLEQEGFENRFTERESISFSYVKLPELTCYALPCPIRNIKECGFYNYRALHDMFDEGFRPNPEVGIFSIMPDADTVYEGVEPEPFAATVCFAIRPDVIPDASKVVHLPCRTAYSMIYHGNRDEMLLSSGPRLYAEMQHLGLKSAGPLYSIGIVRPFSGAEIEPDDYVFRFAVPVE